MPFYRCKVQHVDSESAEIVYRAGRDQFEAADSFRHSRYKVLYVRRDDTYAKRMDHHEYWRGIWNKALANMPSMQRRYKIGPASKWNSINDDDAALLIDWESKQAYRVTQFGEYFALARCLDMKINRCKRRHYWRTDIQIHMARGRGYMPRDPKRRAKLLRLAGPNGTFFARLKLTALGIAHRYKVWPK